MRLRDWLKNLFIPSSNNGFRPNFLEQVSVGIMFILVALTFVMANLHSLLWTSSTWMVSTVLPAVIIDLTNDARLAEHETVLIRNETLDRAATLKAEDMAKNGYFAHYSPTGVSPWHWFDVAGYDFANAGENLAVHFTDSNEIVSAWLDSPGHRANILNAGFTEIGVGTARGEYKGFPTVFVVQLFGTRAARVPAAQEKVAYVEPRDPQSPQPTEIVEVNTPSAGVAEVSRILGSTETVGAAKTESFVTSGEESNNSNETLSTTPETPSEQEFEAENVPSALYSDLATTARNDAIIGISETEETEQSAPRTLPIIVSATQPSKILNFVYAFLATIVFTALVLSIVIEWRHQHPVQIAYAGALIALMVLLSNIHETLTGGVTIL